MVVIEPVSSTDDIQPKVSKSTTTTGVNSSSGDQLNADGQTPITDNKPTAAAGYASDGYETASETEVADDDEAVSESTDIPNVVEHEHQEGKPEVVSPVVKHQSFEDALNDDEYKQKVLTQMNDSKVEGNKLFGDGLYEEALLKYEYAIQLAPEMSLHEIRSICHNNRATCFFKLGKYEDTVKECTKALELNPTYMKALIRRGEAHEKLDNYDEAIADMKKILELDPSNYQSKRTIDRLEPLAVEKREKMKEEMLGKLKDMGNTILGKFGMSVDNFKAVKDPNTGSYSISFQR